MIYIYDGIEMDSKEETHFAAWLDEAKDNGIITEWVYHPAPFTLFDKAEIHFLKTYLTKKLRQKKTKPVTRTLLQKHTYQPDFYFEISENFKIEIKGLKTDCGFGPYMYVDIKGAFQPQHAKNEVFSINQKWLYQERGIYVHRVVPAKFFKETWVPIKFAYCKGRRVPTRVKTYKDCIFVDEYLSKI